MPRDLGVCKSGVARRRWNGCWNSMPCSEGSSQSQFEKICDLGSKYRRLFWICLIVGFISGHCTHIPLYKTIWDEQLSKQGKCFYPKSVDKKTKTNMVYIPGAQYGFYNCKVCFFSKDIYIRYICWSHDQILDTWYYNLTTAQMQSGSCSGEGFSQVQSCLPSSYHYRMQAATGRFSLDSPQRLLTNNVSVQWPTPHPRRFIEHDWSCTCVTGVLGKIQGGAPSLSTFSWSCKRCKETWRVCTPLPSRRWRGNLQTSRHSHNVVAVATGFRNIKVWVLFREKFEEPRGVWFASEL